MALDPALFEKFERDNQTTEPGARWVNATVTQTAEDNFELLLQSIGFPFSPTRKYDYSSKAEADAVLGIESKRFLDHLIACVDR